MKNKFLYNALIMIFTGVFVKLLGLVNRIVITRLLGSVGISIYMLTFPTLILFVSIAQFGMPLAISKLVSESKVNKKYTNKKIILNSLMISLIVSLTLIILLLIIITPLTNNWLKSPETFYPILTTILVLPLVSFTGILKGYFQGLKLMKISAKSQIVEQIARIVSSIILVYLLLPYGLVVAVTGSLISISIGELASLTYLLIKVNKSPKLSKISEFKDNQVIKSILEISIPATGSRLIGSLTYFFEPIIFTFALVSIGIDNTVIKLEYGAISGYAVPLLLMFSFISFSISTALVPNISEGYSRKNFKYINNIVGNAFLLSFIPGLFISFVLYFYSDNYMMLIFGSTNGAKYVKFMAPFFILFYFQTPLIYILQSINKSKEVLKTTILCSIIKLSLIFILTQIPTINTYGLSIAIIVNIILSTLIHFVYLNKHIKFKINTMTIWKFIFIAACLFLYTNFVYGKLGFITASIFCLLLYSTLVFMLNIISIKQIKNSLHS